jgi:hypothetical protein
MDMAPLDREILDSFPTAAYIFRIGSSLHPEWFGPESDIDYIVVVEKFRLAMVNDYPRRTSPRMDAGFYIDDAYNFFWRLSREPYEGHAVTICIYTLDKFTDYIEKRSPPKMYILHEHHLLHGDQDALAALKAANPPDIRTARQDLATLRNPKYAAMWPWGWRSVSIMRGDGWLPNKAAITAYVEQHYPGKLTNKTLLTQELERLINERES